MFKRIMRWCRRRPKSAADWHNQVQEDIAGAVIRIVTPEAENTTELIIRRNGLIIWSQSRGPGHMSVQASVGDASHAVTVGSALAAAAEQASCNFGELLDETVHVWAALAPVRP